MSANDIRTRTMQLVDKLRVRLPNELRESIECEPVTSAPGGGSLPEQQLSSWAIAITSSAPNQVAQNLRLGDPSVFSRVQDDRVLIDLRTVMPEDDEALVSSIFRCITNGGSN
jgi:L-seryl-tRNA(Ser) seleniumtransferase